MMQKLFVMTSILVAASTALLADSEVEEAEVPDYEARYTVFVMNRAESCFFLENMKEGYTINLHYLVISTKNGAQLDISMRIKDPKGRLVAFQARKKEGHFTNYKVEEPGNFELCFNNKFSMYEKKKLMWEVSVDGAVDWQKLINNAINRTMEKFEADSKNVLSAIVKVRHAVARARHQQYWLKSKNSKDSERMITLQGMVDTWSMIYSSLICVVAVAQIFVLRSFFHIKPTSYTGLKMRT